MKTPEQAARELRTKLYAVLDQWSRGGSGPQLVEAAIASDRREQAALVRPLIERIAETDNQTSLTYNAAARDLARQWLAEAEKGAK